MQLLSTTCEGCLRVLPPGPAPGRFLNAKSLWHLPSCSSEFYRLSDPSTFPQPRVLVSTRRSFCREYPQRGKWSHSHGSSHGIDQISIICSGHWTPSKHPPTDSKSSCLQNLIQLPTPWAGEIFQGVLPGLVLVNW